MVLSRFGSKDCSPACYIKLPRALDGMNFGMSLIELFTFITAVRNDVYGHIIDVIRTHVYNVDATNSPPYKLYRTHIHQSRLSKRYCKLFRAAMEGYLLNFTKCFSSNSLLYNCTCWPY